MCNDISNDFSDYSPVADSGLKVIIADEQRSSVSDKKRRLSEPVRLDEILPFVMGDIKRRIVKRGRELCLNKDKQFPCQITEKAQTFLMKA